MFFLGEQEDLEHASSVSKLSVGRGFHRTGSTHSKHQLKRQNSLNKNPTHQRRILRQRSPNLKLRREKHLHQKTGKDTSRKLRANKQSRSECRDTLRQEHGQCNGGVEQPTRNPKEDPHIDHEGETEDEGDVEEDFGGETGFAACGGGLDISTAYVGDLGSGEGEEEEHGRSYEFTQCSNEI